jgi:hypothetical protein
VSAESGVGAGAAQAHRGSSFADFNNDGKIDVVTVSLGGAAELWENVTTAGNTWLAVRLRGVKSNRDGIGARIRAGNQYNHMTSSTGYISSSHGPVHFGTAKASRVERLEIRWPSGAVQVVENAATGQVLEVGEPAIR